MGEMLLNGRLYGANGIRELTQAQYDALPASKLTDGVLYCIKDTGIVEGDQFAPVIYSLEEREIGTWKDGKPLYQKTYYLAQANGNTDTIIDNTADLAVIDTLCSITGVAVNNYNEPMSMPYSYPNINMNCGLTIVTSGIRVTVGQFFTRLTNIYVTLRYTKTADIPGSGTFGLNGVPNVHYDGNEKIIGTWFGETLYEKTFYYSSLPSSGENIFLTDIVVDKVANIYGIMMWNEYAFKLPFVSWDGGLTVELSYNTNTNDIRIHPANSTMYQNISDIYVTVQYTKLS